MNKLEEGTPEQHRARTAEWEARINNMDSFEWPKSFDQRLNIEGKYNRFTKFTKEWIYGILSQDPEKSEITGDVLCEGDRLTSGMKPNWWKLAIQSANKKYTARGLTTYPGSSERDKVYSKFFPAYRAIRESFDNRPWYEWFTNHAQYTAERDSLKAIQGIVRSLTGKNPDYFEAEYENYCQRVPMEVEKVAEVAKETKQEVKQPTKETQQTKQDTKEIKETQQTEQEIKDSMKESIAHQIEEDLKEKTVEQTSPVVPGDPSKQLEKNV